MVEREGRPGQVAADGEESAAGVVSREGRLGDAGEQNVHYVINEKH